jgi:single-strand DNA-binding protein
MANLNKVMLIGRLTRDPEVRTFSNGGKVAKFGFAVNNKRKNPSTGEMEDDPVFIDVDAFNRGDYGKLADVVEQYLKKGRQIFIEGHLKLDQWTSQDGQKRSKLTVIADNVQFLEPRGEGGPGEGGGRGGAGYSSSSTPRRSTAPASAPAGYGEHAPEPEPAESADANRPEEEIPF